jgi:sulfonate transport system permease protein
MSAIVRSGVAPRHQPPAQARVLRRAPRRTSEAANRYLRRRRMLEVSSAVLVPTVLLALWQVAATRGWIDDRLYPAPSAIAQEARRLFESGRLGRDVRATLGLLFRGYVIGCMAGFAVGAFMGTSRLARKAFEPLLNGLYTVPKLALLPLFLGMFGLGDGPKVAMVVVTVFFFVWIQTMEAFATVPEGYLEAARSLGVSRTTMFLHVRLPAAMPQLFVGLRMAMSVGILVIIAAEFVIGSEGLGYLINSARQVFIYTQAYVGIAASAILGVVLSGLIGIIGRRCTPWERTARRAIAKPR